MLVVGPVVELCIGDCFSGLGVDEEQASGHGDAADSGSMGNLVVGSRTEAARLSCRDLSYKLVLHFRIGVLLSILEARARYS